MHSKLFWSKDFEEASQQLPTARRSYRMRCKPENEKVIRKLQQLIHRIVQYLDQLTVRRNQQGKVSKRLMRPGGKIERIRYEPRQCSIEERMRLLFKNSGKTELLKEGKPLHKPYYRQHFVWRDQRRSGKIFTTSWGRSALVHWSPELAWSKLRNQATLQCQHSFWHKQSSPHDAEETWNYFQRTHGSTAKKLPIERKMAMENQQSRFFVVAGFIVRGKRTTSDLRSNAASHFPAA